MQTSSSSSPVAIAILIALGSTVTVAGIAALRTRSFDERAALRATINEPAPVS
jgi:hypothetical protein